jgi:hypothetical protein
MFGIFAKTFMTATRQSDARAEGRRRWDAPPSWLEEDLPFRNHAGRRTGRDD